MIDIQHHALRAFKQDTAPKLFTFVKNPPGRPGKSQDIGGDRKQVRFQGGGIRSWQIETGA